jgi:hypothetical protein
LTERDEGAFFQYLALLIGMAFLGAYFWLLLTPTIVIQTLWHFLLIVSGILLVASTLALGASTTRSGRTGLTMLTGVFGGVHGYLDLILFNDLFVGVILFAWIAFSLLIAFAAFSWLRE